MEILLWLMIAVLVLTPKKAAGNAAGFDKLRSVVLLLSFMYLIGQHWG